MCSCFYSVGLFCYSDHQRLLFHWWEFGECLDRGCLTVILILKWTMSVFLTSTTSSKSRGYSFVHSRCPEFPKSQCHVSGFKWQPFFPCGLLGPSHSKKQMKFSYLCWKFPSAVWSGTHAHVMRLFSLVLTYNVWVR